MCEAVSTFVCSREDSSRGMSHDNISPQVISRIMREIRDLSRKPVDGITYVDNAENSVSEIHAVISGPGAFDAAFRAVP